MRERWHQMAAAEVLEALYPLLLQRGTPTYIRSDNGPEFASSTFQDWLRRVGIEPIRVCPGSPLSAIASNRLPGSDWENGYNERFIGALRNAEWLATTHQAQSVINTWLRQYNHIRPHHALGMRPPVPETILEKPKISGPNQGTRHLRNSAHHPRTTK